MTGDALSQLTDFLVRLRAGHRSVAGSDDDDGPSAVYTLSLCVAALEDLVFYASSSRHRVPQVVVMGPTQVGKSTLVNLLLERDAARPSPLAGFTRSLQGFAVNVADASMDALRTFMSKGGDVDGEVSVADFTGGRGGPVLVWDTPDFDSHASREYRTLLPRVAGVADVLLLVLSKEKYADLSVWTMLDPIRMLQTPLVVCLNKTDQPEQLLAPLTKHIVESGFDPGQVAIYSLPYVGSAQLEELNALSAAADLRRTVMEHVVPRDRTARVAGAKRLMEKYWNVWIAPVREELAGLDAWQRDIDEVLAGALAVYREQYLDHARYENTFNRAVLRLLELLEIPGIAGAMTQLRRVLTWPLRRLRVAGVDRQPRSGEDAETEVLTELFDHLWLVLERRLNDRIGDDHAGRWCRALRDALPPTAEIRRDYLSAVGGYQKSFQPEVEQAGERLYDRLQESPLTLNTLRAGRVGADAAGVVVALKTGTVGITEAVLTPAMLSLTSVLTESAVGRYVDSVRDDLRQRQYLQVEKLLDGLLRAKLLAVPENMDERGLFNIGAEALTAADAARRALT
jgi:hypothetical protein